VIELDEDEFYFCAVRRVDSSDIYVYEKKATLGPWSISKEEAGIRITVDGVEYYFGVTPKEIWLFENEVPVMKIKAKDQIYTLFEAAKNKELASRWHKYRKTMFRELLGIIAFYNKLEGKELIRPNLPTITLYLDEDFEVTRVVIGV